MIKIYKKLKDTNDQILSSLNAYNNYLECVLALSSHRSTLCQRLSGKLFQTPVQNFDLCLFRFKFNFEFAKFQFRCYLLVVPIVLFQAFCTSKLCNVN